MKVGDEVMIVAASCPGLYGVIVSCDQRFLGDMWYEVQTETGVWLLRGEELIPWE